MYDSYVNLQHILKVVIFSIFVNLQKCCKFTYESYAFFLILFFVLLLAIICDLSPYKSGSLRRPHVAPL